MKLNFSSFQESFASALFFGYELETFFEYSRRIAKTSLK